MISMGTGSRVRMSLEPIGAGLTAKHVGCECADGSCEGMDNTGRPGERPSSVIPPGAWCKLIALHPRMIVAFVLLDAVLPVERGDPVEICTPTEPGFKNPENVITIAGANPRSRGLWTDRGNIRLSGI